jgi:hypothetical protein
MLKIKIYNSIFFFSQKQKTERFSLIFFNLGIFSTNFRISILISYSLKQKLGEPKEKPEKKNFK